MARRLQLYKFPAKAAKTSLCLITAAGAVTLATESLDGDSSLTSAAFPESIRTGLSGIVRSSRAVWTIASNVVDYKYSLHGMLESSEDYQCILSEVHQRSARRILRLCEANKGFYVKAGQFVAALRQVPKEYSSTLSSLQDQAVPCRFKAIKEVLTTDLGADLSDIFLKFDQQPIAAASIAQVHRAILKDHEEVAVKVQYPGLEQQLKVDTTTMFFLSKTVAWFFPEYRFGWMVSEFAEHITLELDFLSEGRNSERIAKNFRSNSVVRVPRVFWEFTTSKVLTMQFCKGCKVDDLVCMREMGINPQKVAKALVDVFAEMIFVHGFLHGDPHPGNILVSSEGQKGFSIVLLDHGICKKLDEEFRLDYCRLWKALILLDSNKIQQLGVHFGVGKYSRYFPLIFTGRMINSKSALGRGISEEEKKDLKQEMKSLKMEDISSFMESLPPDFLTILKIDGLLRSLLAKLGASNRDRMLAYAKYALRGLSPKLNPETDNSAEAGLSRLVTDMGYLRLRLVIEILDMLIWIEKARHSLLKRLKQILSSAGYLLQISFPFWAG